MPPGSGRTLCRQFWPGMRVIQKHKARLTGIVSGVYVLTHVGRGNHSVYCYLPPLLCRLPRKKNKSRAIALLFTT